MDHSDDRKSASHVGPAPLLCLPAPASLEAIARGEVSPEEDLVGVRQALEALARLSPSSGEAAELLLIERAERALAAVVSGRMQEHQADKGYEEYDDYFSVVRLRDHPLHTFTQGLLTSYRNFLRELRSSHSVTPIELGMLRSAIQSLAADLQESLQRKGEAQ